MSATLQAFCFCGIFATLYVSYYRDVYLKSEDWKNLRAAVLATKAPDGKCSICLKAKPLDVHHIDYKNLWDVHPKDLQPLCRGCHDQVHEILENHPEWKVLRPRQRWCRVWKILGKDQTDARIKIRKLQKYIARLKASLAKAEADLIRLAFDPDAVIQSSY